MLRHILIVISRYGDVMFADCRYGNERKVLRASAVGTLTGHDGCLHDRPRGTPGWVNSR